MSTFTSIEALILQQQANGKAFEYACAAALKNRLSARRFNAAHLETDAFRTAARRFSELSISNQNLFRRAAGAGVRVLENLEPNLRTSAHVSDRYVVKIQADVEGESGDVRDVLVNKESGWQIGFSIKHNNDATKHSRLSGTIDFGKVWLDRNCDAEYFRAVNVAFDELEAFARIGAHWDSLGISTEEKAKQFYRPVLEAFLAQLERFITRDAGVPAKLFRYLIGKKDFYKVMAATSEETTTVEVYSFDGTLGQAAAPGDLQPTRNIPRLNVPTKITAKDLKASSDNTIIIRFDEGWAVSLRLHNASSRIEPSLKLDVRLTAAPATLLKIVERWSA
ncbi:MAG: HaeIII family restriction endonuclease [Pyrinomonadaceae bacterium]|nr:HaeIII family restriction endonuclease [Pyrinomonadaceae bacterium]